MTTAHSFSFFEFLSSPLISIAFLFLMLGTVSFWVFNRIWVWGSILLAACGVAYFAKMLQLEIFIPILLLLCGYLVLKTDIKGLARGIVCVIVALLSLAFSFHLYPDIQNFLLADGLNLSKGAPSFNYYWNFDKPFIGFFILGLRLKLIENKEDLKRIATKTLLFAVGFLGVFIVGALMTGVVQYDFKFPWIAIPWLIGNLFFTVIPEECFFRGFLQEEVRRAIKSRLAPFFSMFLVSIVFAAAHIFFIHNFSYIAIAFLASFAYGLIYHITKSIESSIFCHYLLNVIHFIFFTYPILSSAM